MYLQWFKTSYSMLGNLNTLATAAGSYNLKTATRTGRRLGKDAVLKRTLVPRALKRHKERRIKTLLKEAKE